MGKSTTYSSQFARWRMGGFAATVPEDGNNYPLTRDGVARIDNGYGKTGYAAGFFLTDGLSNAGNLAFRNALVGDWTISFWIFPKTASAGVDGNILSYLQAGGNNIARIILTSATKIKVDWTGATTTFSTYTLPLNAWTHITIVKSPDGGNKKLQLYAGGFLVETASGLTNAADVPGASLVMGGIVDGMAATNYLKSVFLNEVSVWASALTQAQIQTEYDTNRPFSFQERMVTDMVSLGASAAMWDFGGATYQRSFGPEDAISVTSDTTAVYPNGVVSPYSVYTGTLSCSSGIPRSVEIIFRPKASAVTLFQIDTTVLVQYDPVAQTVAVSKFDTVPVTGSSMDVFTCATTPTTWLHLAVSISGSNTIVYANGVKLGTINSITPTPSSGHSISAGTEDADIAFVNVYQNSFIPSDADIARHYGWYLIDHNMHQSSEQAWDLVHVQATAATRQILGVSMQDAVESQIIPPETQRRDVNIDITRH